MVRLGQRYETFCRPTKRTVIAGSRGPLDLVVHSHLIRAIQLADGVLSLRENQVQKVLLRVLCETYINLHFIESDPELCEERAANFHDFWKVNRLRLLTQIGDLFPDVLEQARASLPELKEELDHFRDRFAHPRQDGSAYWDWDRRDLVSRVHEIARQKKRSGEAPLPHKRIIAVYQETNPWVHSGMLSMMESVEMGGGFEAQRPTQLSRRELQVSLMAAVLLVDIIAACTRFFGDSAFDAEIAVMQEKCAAAVAAG